MRAAVQGGLHMAPGAQRVSTKELPTSTVPTMLYNPGTPGKWKPTIITGLIETSSSSSIYMRAAWHVVMWLVTLGLAGACSFGIQAGDGGFLAPDDDDQDLSDSSYVLAPSDTTKMIGLWSGISLFLGFAFMLTMASCFEVEYFQEWGWPNVVLQILTNYGFVGQLYILIHAGAKPENSFFSLSAASCVFTGYLVVLLYCISASMDFLMLPRGFISSLALCFHLVNYLVIDADEGGAPVGGYTDEQKMIALSVVLLNASALVVMVFLRLYTRSTPVTIDFKKQDLGDWPFFRSIVLTMYSAAAALSVYKWNFTSNANPGVWCFSALSVFTQFLIMAVIFYPSSAAAGGVDEQDNPKYPDPFPMLARGYKK